jgi:hypothetical protein
MKSLEGIGVVSPYLSEQIATMVRINNILGDD